MAVRIHVVGRLGSNAEIKTTKEKREFTTFRLAVDDYERGEKKTAWFSIVDTTPNCVKRAEFLKKGTLVNVIGKEVVRIYTDKSGFPQIGRDIIVEAIDFIPTPRTENKIKEEEVSCGKLDTVKIEENNVLEPKPTQTVSAPTAVTTHTVPQYATATAISTASSDDFIDDLPF